MKRLFKDDGGPSSSRAANTSWLSDGVRSLSNGSMKKEDNMMGSGRRANIHVDGCKPPYFLYGNGTDITKDTWQGWSEFLFSVQPELINTDILSSESECGLYT